MKIKKNLIVKNHNSIIDQAKKYHQESNLILGNIETEVIQANKEFNNIYKPLEGDFKSKTLEQLKREYFESLTGYNIDKTKYKYVRTIDPDDLTHFNNNLRNSLAQNKDFYLYGDRNFLSSNY